ncbi:MAG: Dabb family protein [Dysgonomonas sp.]
MVKHIVLWKLKEEAHGNDKASNAKQIKKKLENLRGKINGLISIEVGIDFFGEGNYDVSLFVEVLSRDTLNAYQNHPLHQAVLPFIKEAASDRVAVDYEIEE